MTGPVNEDKGLDVPASKDDDPDGTKLLSSPDGLERAAKLLRPLTNLAKGDIEVWIAVYDVAVRRSKRIILLRNLPSPNAWIFAQKSICRLLKLSTTPTHWTLNIRSCTSVLSICESRVCRILVIPRVY